ncbi:hypothetical protein ACVXZY_15165 [Staphylococcus aureus]
MNHQETTSQQYNFSIIKHGDISTPQGFTAGGMHIGLRANKRLWVDLLIVFGKCSCRIYFKSV